MVQVEHRKRFAGEDHPVVMQPDGTLATKAQIEQHGYCTDVGLDGVPIDPNHPFNRAR